MNPIESLLSEPFGQALGWTLLHFVWQGGLVALMLALALFLLRRRAAQVRYVVACAALALLVVLPIVTFSLLLPASVEGSMLLSTPTMDAAGVSAGATALPTEPVGPHDATVSWRQQAAVTLAAALPWLVLLWMAGVLALSMRYLAGWTYTIRLRRRGTREVGQRWLDQLARLTQQMGVRRAIRLFSSTRVQVPTVTGWLRPVILMPVSVFTGLSPRQIEMIIAHELAHIRRHDYLVNLLQAACETVLFYHPAVWWISHRIRVEREHCCDDVVVSVCGDAFTYAAALAKMEEVRKAVPRLALAATGGSLLRRVRRLLENPEDASPRAARWLAGLAVLATFLLSLFFSSALSNIWTQTHAWIAGREAREQPGGLLFITTENDQGVLVETFQEDGTSYTMMMRGAIRVQMRTGSHFTVDYQHESRPEKRGNATTLMAPLTLEMWHHERKLSRWDVPDGTVVFEPSDVRSSSEHVTVDGRSSIRSLPRPLAQAGYEKTAALLEELIFEDQSTSVQLEALDELRVLPARASVLSLVRIAETHPSQRVGMEAIQWVGRQGDAYVVPALEGIVFDDRSLPVQMEALDALRNLPDKMGLPSLIKIAQTHPRPEMRNEAVQWIGRLGDEAARVTLERILYEDADPSVQLETLDALLNLPQSIDENALHELSVTHPDEEIRREARAWKERKQQQRIAKERLQRERTLRMQPNPSRDAHVDTAERLETVDVEDEASFSDRMFAALHVAENHPAASRRAEAVQELREWSSVTVITILADIAYEDPSLAVQMEALDALRDRGDWDGTSWVVHIAQNHPSAQMRREAVQSLEDLKTDELLPLLEEIIFRDESLEVQMEALDQVNDLPEAVRVPILAKVTSRPNLPDAVRREAAEMLADR